MRKILLVNDDGIAAEGLSVLAELAADLGQVWITAPDTQKSAAAHSVVINRPIKARKVSVSAPVEAAFAIDSTPADCVRMGIDVFVPQKPDFVFSGINYGYNAGSDIIYSGTVAAAQEGLLQGIPSVAFSLDRGASYEVVRSYFQEVMNYILSAPPLKDSIWNVNFPNCTPEECRGIRTDCFIDADLDQLRDHYIPTSADGDVITYTLEDRPYPKGACGSDLEALSQNYVTITTVRNTLL